MFVSATPSFADASGGWGTIASPLTITFLLLFVSGINLLEKSSAKRYGHLPEYKEYLAKTSNLIPFPPALFKPLPDAVKTVLFFEWPMYAGGDQEQQSALTKTEAPSPAEGGTAAEKEKEPEV